MMMKHVFSFVLLGLGAAALGGCPIYSGDDQAHRDRVCVGSDCYSCPDPYLSDSCYGYACSSATDCPTGYACASNNRCYVSTATPATCAKPSDCASGSTCGADNQCHTGNCSTTGCPSSYVCKLTNGAATCEPTTTTPPPGTKSTCSSDTDCMGGAGAKCLSGACVNPVDQCADVTQCAGGSQCVAGECTPSCSATKPCPTGYGCDSAKGVCTQNPGACTSSTQCTGGTVCVQQHCVDGCGAGGACAPGLVCVDGGCTPDEKPIFTCATDGVKDKCQAGSICLRHSCYISCDAQVAESCKGADKFNVCKSVTTSSGPHSVCGSDTNLGTECDPTQAKNCATPLVCIDGFCR